MSEPASITMTLLNYKRKVNTLEKELAYLLETALRLSSFLSQISSFFILVVYAELNHIEQLNDLICHLFL